MEKHFTPFLRITRWTACSVLTALLLALPAIASAKPADSEPDSIDEASDKIPMLSPLRVAMLQSGDLLVTDPRAQRVFTVSRNNLKVRNGFPIAGDPLGIAYHKGHVIVGNSSKRRVEAYTREGELLGVYGGPKWYVGRASDIAVDEVSNRVVVLDAKEKTVKVFSLDGPFLFSIPESYPDPSVLNNPTAVAIDPATGDIYVSDYGDPTAWVRASIKIFDPDGSPQGQISGKAGMFGNRFSRPQGLAIDDNHLFVIDCYSGEIVVFDVATKAKIATLSGFGDASGEMRLPLDLVIDDKSKNIFVTNNRGGRIEFFPAGAQLP